MSAVVDAVELAVFQSRVHSIAEEMGAALRRTAVSPNIKERRDYSCAVFDGQGRVIAMGDHMPVHLGSMPMSVQAAIDAIAFEPGDIASPERSVCRWNAPAGHHDGAARVCVMRTARRPFMSRIARITRMSAGHLRDRWDQRREIFQEGIRIPPVRIVRRGEVCREILDLILLNVRTPNERRGDLDAQIGSCRVGEMRVRATGGKVWCGQTAGSDRGIA